MSNWRIRLAALGLSAATVVAAVVLVSAGMPIPLAGTAVLLFASIAVGAVERRMAREAPVFGVAGLCVASLCGVLAAVEAVPGVDGRIVAAVTVLLELGAILGAILLYRRTRTATSVLARRRMAARRGWRYQREATIRNGTTTVAGRDLV